MVKRIVIVRTASSNGVAISKRAACTVPLLIAAIGLQSRPFRAPSWDELLLLCGSAILEKSPVTLFAMSAILVLLLTFLLFGISPKRDEEGVAVSMYPLGVQLATVWVKENEATGTSTRKPRAFIPRDQIVDCVVTEVIWAHKVQSVVVFRVESCQGKIQLISAFPGVEMTYRECLQARSQINAYLTNFS